MANPEHLAILKKSVEFWNKWREENPALKPGLRKAYLPKTRDALKREAKSSDQYYALAEVSDAETAAKTGKGQRLWNISRKLANGPLMWPGILELMLRLR
jgi:hypothetical protein